MKTPTPRLILSSLIAMSAAHLSAQTVEFIAVEKVSDYIRNGDGVFLKIFDGPNQISPFQFRIDVEGSALNPPGFSTPTFSAPTGSSYLLPDPPADGSNHGNLFFNSPDWSRTFIFAVKGPTVSGYPGGAGPHPGGLDGVFANGVYTVTAGGEPVSIQLGGASDADAYPGVPNPTVSAGTWDGGGMSRLYHNVNNPLTINTGIFADFGETYVSGLNLYIGSNGSDVVDMLSLSTNLFGLNLSDGVYADFLEHTFAANSLTVGTEYYVSIEYFNLTDYKQVAGLDDAMAIGLFTSRTQFSITVVPEPSTYAAIAGALALVGVIAGRRRHT